MDRSAIVIGAGPGIGASVARRFSRAGFAVGLIARSRPTIDATLADLSGGPAVGLTADVTDEPALRAALDDLVAQIGAWLGVQALVNIGVNMGVLPTKGLTLPLLSYGRSSLLVSLGWLGVLLRIHHEVKCTSRSAVMRVPGGAAK